jgi:Domain of unknown function (DUF4157)
MITFAAKQPTENSFQQKQHEDLGRSPLAVSSIRFQTISPPSTGIPLLQRQCACGGGCPRCKDNLKLQTKLKIGEPGDVYEQEADRVADEVMRMPEPTIQRQIEQDDGMLQMKAISNSITPLQRSSTVPNQSAEVPEIVNDVLRSPGQPLDSATRALMEPRFGNDFSQVRVHTGEDADRSARDVNAHAYTVGHNIVFGAGRFAPGTMEGRRLIAHELTHTLQQNDRAVSTSKLQRQPQSDDKSASKPNEQSNLSPFSLPWTGLTVFPGALNPGLLGSSLPLPASLRLTNALSVGTEPSYVLDLSPRLFVASILGNINLQSGTAQGTPPDSPVSAENQANLSLVNPLITLNPTTGKLWGRAILSVPTGYPLTMAAPTEVSVEIDSTELGAFRGKLGYGPLVADFTLKLKYDTDRLEGVISPVFAPQDGIAGFWMRLRGILQNTIPEIEIDNVADTLKSILRSLQHGTVQIPKFISQTLSLVKSSIPPSANLDNIHTALREFATEISHPGFSLNGRLRLGSLSLSGFSATAPTTQPLERPLLDAPAAFPLTTTAYGVIVAPPGSLFPMSVPAFGATHSSFGATNGFSATGAFVPSLSPAAITAGESLARQFPVYAYAEISYVQRVNKSLDLGVRLTAQASTPELSNPAAATDSTSQFLKALENYKASQADASSTPLLPTVGLTVYGRFQGF